jgi:hypothetical protein
LNITLHVQLLFKVNKYRIHLKLLLSIFSARDEEPLDPSFVQFPQSVHLEEGGKAKFNCKLSGTTPMTGKNSTLFEKIKISFSLS